MSKIWGIPSPYKLGAPKLQIPPFSPTSQPNGNFNGLHLRNETWYRQSVMCIENYKGCATLSQNVMNFGPQTASNSTAILPTIRKFCILLYCQTEISKQNSTKLCQKADGKLFTNPHYFVPSQSIAHPLIGINVVPHSDCKWNGIGFVCGSDSKPHKMLSCICYRVGRP